MDSCPIPPGSPYAEGLACGFICLAMGGLTGAKDAGSRAKVGPTGDAFTPFLSTFVNPFDAPMEVNSALLRCGTPRPLGRAN